MIIATFNANSLRARLPILLSWLQKNQPDILCIQETKVQDPDFPVEALEQTGYEFVFRGQKKYNGVAILSRQPIKSVRFGLDDEPKDEARLICATIEGIRILNTYIPQGFEPDSEQFRYKLQWFQRLRKYMDQHFTPKDPLLWLGDFNVARDQRDVHDADTKWGHVCYCQEVHEALTHVMDWGFTDLFRQFHEDAELYTFWDYRVPNGFKRNLGWRLDYIMATEPMAKACKRCWIDKEPRGLPKPSDHTFLLAEFDL